MYIQIRVLYQGQFNLSLSGTMLLYTRPLVSTSVVLRTFLYEGRTLKHIPEAAVSALVFRRHLLWTRCKAHFLRNAMVSAVNVWSPYTIFSRSFSTLLSMVKLITMAYQEEHTEFDSNTSYTPGRDSFTWLVGDTPMLIPSSSRSSFWAFCKWPRWGTHEDICYKHVGETSVNPMITHDSNSLNQTHLSSLGQIR